MHVASSDKPSMVKFSPNCLQLFLPVAIRFDLVDKDGALLAPVAGRVSLTISVQIQPADATAPAHWILPDPGVHCASLPLDVVRKADVHR